VTERDEWVILRDQHGHIQARYHPGTRRLIIRERKIDTPHDLSIYHAGQPIPQPYLQEETLVVG
jgi:hypothetical protein